MSIENVTAVIGLLLALFVAVIGATTFILTKLSKIDSTLASIGTTIQIRTKDNEREHQGHRQATKDLMARVVKLEDYRARH